VRYLTVMALAGPRIVGPHAVTADVASVDVKGEEVSTFGHFTNELS